MTKDLYTPKDVAAIREHLIQEQEMLCSITGYPTAIKDYHVDHRHDDEQLVRGAANKHANMLLGKIENLELRFLRHWYPHGLPEFLRACAAYLEKKPDKRWRHPDWIKRIKTEFNKLNEQNKDQVLVCLNQPKGKNSTERKKHFNLAILTKLYGRDKIMFIINKVKGNT